MTKRKLTSISLEEKCYAIQRLEKIASKFCVKKATLSRWVSKEQMTNIKEVYESNTVGIRKILRSSVYEDLEITIHEWFKQHRALNLPINGPTVLKKIKKIIIMIIPISII